MGATTHNNNISSKKTRVSNESKPGSNYPPDKGYYPPDIIFIHFIRWIGIYSMDSTIQTW